MIQLIQEDSKFAKGWLNILKYQDTKETDNSLVFSAATEGGLSSKTPITQHLWAQESVLSPKYPSYISLSFPRGKWRINHEEAEPLTYLPLTIRSVLITIVKSIQQLTIIFPRTSYRYIIFLMCKHKRFQVH